MHNFVYIHQIFTSFCSYFTVHISRKKEHHENYQPFPPQDPTLETSKPIEAFGEKSRGWFDVGVFKS